MSTGGRCRSNHFGKISVFKEVEETPDRFTGALCPTNLEEQKQRFLKFGITPKFILKESTTLLDKLSKKKRADIRFDLYVEAKKILDMVRKKYGDGKDFLRKNYGKQISHLEATQFLADYLEQHNSEGEMTVYWAENLTCSARMMWHGPNTKYNKPEARKYSLIIKKSADNHFLSEKGIQCLADHEIGTHYFRMINDGLQPWFSDRRTFGLRGTRGRTATSSEEGLAALSTAIHSNTRCLWNSALLYYVACKAAEMTFSELFDHLAQYVYDPEQRWKHVMRVKRGLQDPNSHGGYGSDQCYFEGAVEILRNVHKIDFNLLFCGKICIDELPRVRRLARMNCIRTPHFLQDIEKYKKVLLQIGYVNGILERPDKKLTAQLLRKRVSCAKHGKKSYQDTAYQTLNMFQRKAMHRLRKNSVSPNSRSNYSISSSSSARLDKGTLSQVRLNRTGVADYDTRTTPDTERTSPMNLTSSSCSQWITSLCPK